MTRPVPLLALPLFACTVLAEQALDDDASVFGDAVQASAGGAIAATTGKGVGGTGATGGSVETGCGAVPSEVAPCPDDDDDACTGGCADGVCRIRCEGKDACKDATKTCPPGLHCEVSCAGKSACKAATFSCPAEHRCALSCDGDDACADAIVVGAAGPLSVVCGIGKSACDHLAVDCGVGSCEVSCLAGGPRPQVSCGSACRCQTCDPGGPEH